MVILSESCAKRIEAIEKGLNYYHSPNQSYCPAGFVYIIQSGRDSYYKVGFSAANPQRRLASMQVSTPEELTLVYYIESDRAATIEKLIHSMLRNNHIRGEWFNLDDRDLAWLKTKLKKFAEMPLK